LHASSYDSTFALLRKPFFVCERCADVCSLAPVVAASPCRPDAQTKGHPSGTKHCVYVMDRGSFDLDYNTSSDESDKVAPKDFMRSLPDSGKRTRVTAPDIRTKHFFTQRKIRAPWVFCIFLFRLFQPGSGFWKKSSACDAFLDILNYF